MDRETFKAMLVEVLPEVLSENLSLEIDFNKLSESLEVRVYWNDEHISTDATYIS